LVIYKVTNTVNDKVYIGQTIRPLSDRWKQHLRDGRSFNYPFYRAIRKYGEDSFIIEEIDGANSLSELNYLEQHYIYMFKSLTDQNGYNILPGGKNFKMPQSVRDKISNSLLGRKQIPKISKEEKSGIARVNGLKLVKDEKWAISNGSKPFRVYKAIRVSFRKKNQLSVYKKGEYVGEWLMTTECAKDLKINSGHIRSCLINTRKQHKGYLFERINDNI
jgi:group I intron endonuclease